MRNLVLTRRDQICLILVTIVRMQHSSLPYHYVFSSTRVTCVLICAVLFRSSLCPALVADVCRIVQLLAKGDASVVQRSAQDETQALMEVAVELLSCIDDTPPSRERAARFGLQPDSVCARLTEWMCGNGCGVCFFLWLYSACDCV